MFDMWNLQVEKTQRSEAAGICIPGPGAEEDVGFGSLIGEGHARECLAEKVVFRVESQKESCPSLKAIDWISANQEGLIAAGWASVELYQRDNSQGLLWLDLWDNEKLTVTLSKDHDDGRVIFRWINEQGRERIHAILPDKTWAAHKDDPVWWPAP